LTAEVHVVIVTGAGGGLGGAMARGLLEAGRRVVGVDIDAGTRGLDALRADAERAGHAARLRVMIADIRSPDAADAVAAGTLSEFGAVHGLVNNAALGPYGRPGQRLMDPAQTFLDVDVTYWTELIDTNINGPFLMTRAVAPKLVAAGWGRIVNITTSLATMVMRGMAPYGPAKAALEANSAIWAQDLAETGVTVNVLVPGGMADTAFLPVDAQPNRAALISPQVMVAPIVWLTSRASDGTTAQRIIAKDWQPGASVEANLRAAAAPVWRHA
jgi:NAD(P)-dependent dehydrogenase (short-subunit alcohol dehydrogenase family)